MWYNKREKNMKRRFDANGLQKKKEKEKIDCYAVKEYTHNLK